MKYQVLFFLKSNEKIFKTMVCCSHAWRCKVYETLNSQSHLVGDINSAIFLFPVHVIVIQMSTLQLYLRVYQIYQLSFEICLRRFSHPLV